MKLPRHPWLILLYRAYARIHGLPDAYARAAKLGNAIRAELERRRQEARDRALVEYYTSTASAIGLQNDLSGLAACQQQIGMADAYGNRAFSYNYAIGIGGIGNSLGNLGVSALRFF